jgi:hypothetical protein
MAKKKGGGLYLLLAAAGIGAFIYARKKKEDQKAIANAVNKAAVSENAASNTELQGYVMIGS